MAVVVGLLAGEAADEIRADLAASDSFEETSTIEVLIAVMAFAAV